MRGAFLAILGLTTIGRLAFADGNPPHHLTPVPLQQVTVDDEFWSPKRKVWNQVTIIDALTKFERDGAIANFDKVRDGQVGEHGGPPWYDGLIYEMIRGAADFMVAYPSPTLEKRLDDYIDRIAAAQAKDPDGYINTYTQTKEPTHRWGLNGGNDNWQHDVFNAGAMVEAGVHYYRATGKTKLLQAAARLTNHMCDVMGPPPKKNVVPGHSIAEEAVLKLYLLFRDHPDLKKQMPFPIDENRYLKLVEFWIDYRGNHEGRSSYDSYAQDHKPVRQQETIEGHSVRATLLCTGLIATATVNGRQDYYQSALRLWNNMAHRRTHITGGVGAVAGYEGFGPDYILPNNAYLETCAAICAGFFHRNMNLAFADATYVDELERALYNGALAGTSLQGDTYFYENPLEAGPERSRWVWHGCPCCPPMFLKIMGAIPEYIYATDPNGIYVNLFVGSRMSTSMGGDRISLRQTTRYPWDGAVRLTLDIDKPVECDINLRIPGWCEGARIRINNQLVGQPQLVRGYARLHRQWASGDVIELLMPMPIQRIKAHPKVEANVGRIALMRGPIVYCLEGIDNFGRVRNLVISPDAPLSAEHRPDLLGGVTVIKGQALSLKRVDWKDSLYLPVEKVPGISQFQFTAIPYYANANRKASEMLVWAAETPSQATPTPPPSIASEAIARTSYYNRVDALGALSDQLEPKSSADETMPRFTWADHKGTKEWVQYEFDKPCRISGIEVYWWNETRPDRPCRVPQSWRLLYRNGTDWVPVANASEYATRPNQYNKTTFDPIDTTGLRIEVQLQPAWSAGILEWKLLQ